MQEKILFKFILILMFLIQIDIPMAYAEGTRICSAILVAIPGIESNRETSS